MSHTQIHRVILAETSQYFTEDVPQNARLRILFQNFRQVGNESYGLRLRYAGHKLLSSVFEFWEYKHSEHLTNKILLDLDSQMNWPYYVGKSVIVFYSQTHAAMFRLNGGDLSTIASYL